MSLSFFILIYYKTKLFIRFQQKKYVERWKWEEGKVCNEMKCNDMCVLCV